MGILWIIRLKTRRKPRKDGYNSAEIRVKDGLKDAHFHEKTELQTLQEDGKRCRKPAKMARKRVKVRKGIIRAPGKTVQSPVKDGVKVVRKTEQTPNIHGKDAG